MSFMNTITWISCQIRLLTNKIQHVSNKVRLSKFGLESTLLKRLDPHQSIRLLNSFQQGHYLLDVVYLWPIRWSYVNARPIWFVELTHWPTQSYTVHLLWRNRRNPKHPRFLEFTYWPIPGYILQLLPSYTLHLLWRRRLDSRRSQPTKSNDAPTQKQSRKAFNKVKFTASIAGFVHLINISLKRAPFNTVLIFCTTSLFRMEILLRQSFSFGFFYLQGLTFTLCIDACLTDDEPLWEPIEWSLVQTWLLFTFMFAWVAENLIVSRYGSYTGRDKRVWMAWYKTFYLIEGYYILNYGVVCVFVIVPFYFETNYSLAFVYSWWHWYSRVFFLKFTSTFTVILLISYYLQVNLRWLNWKKGLALILLINIFLLYLIYTQFIITFFGYFTDPIWYQKTRPVDYIQLSHEPSRWGWGSAKKDHFTYHNVKTIFWFKNDGPFAASFLLFQTFLFVCTFLLYIYWVSLFRRVYATKEIPLTYTTYCVSSLKQFFYLFLIIYTTVFLSYLSNYSRFPIEFLWTLDTQSWVENFVDIVLHYPVFLFAILF